MAKSYRIILMGAQNVGKTSLLDCYFNHPFEEKKFPTIEDTYTVVDRMLENQYVIDIVDTGGDQEFVNVRDHWIKEGLAFILVYSVACKESFIALEGIKKDMTAVGRLNTPVVVVGNKCDLVKDRIVNANDGAAFSKSFIDSYFVETSAKTKMNVKEIFHYAIQRIGQNILEGMPEAEKNKHNCFIL